MCAGNDDANKLEFVFLQELVATVLNVPANRIITHTRRVGGAFGGKFTKPPFFAAAAAVAAHK